MQLAPVAIEIASSLKSRCCQGIVSGTLVWKGVLKSLLAIYHHDW